MDLRPLHRRLFTTLAFAALLGVAAPATAGRSCDSTAPTIDVVKKSTAMAKRTQAAMDAGGQDVYILARIGQDLSKYGLTYSHLALVTRDGQDGSWTIFHELNDCGTAGSRVFSQGLLEFFGDDLFRYEAAVVSLPKDVQARVKQQLLTAPKAFHEPSYSVVAYPFSTKHQNSNQWLLETLGASMSSDFKLETREQAQAWLKAAGFQPTELNIGSFERLGGRVFKAQVAFDDHPGDLRWSDRIRTTTAESIFRFLEKRYPADYRLETVELY
jgi:hypothetical protein